MTDRAFVPGWLPQGWKRGAQLHVTNPRCENGPRAALMLAETAMLPLCIASDTDDTATVEYHQAQRIQVLEWLRWFCFACDYVDIASRI